MTARLIPAATVTVALDDVSVDQLCFEHALSVLRDRRAAGRLAGYVEATLAANPGLAAHGAALLLGTTVQLPEFEVAAGRAVERLWPE